MTWGQVQLKYQLLHILEHLKTWARFSSVTHFQEFSDLEVEILSDNPNLNRLERIKSDIWRTVGTLADTDLVRKLTPYFPEEKYGTQNFGAASTT